MTRRAALGVLVSALALAGVLAAQASPRAPAVALAVPPAGSPDLSQMALGLADLPAGAAVASEGYGKDETFLGSYRRRFLPGILLGKSKILFLESDIYLTADRGEAALDFVGASFALKTKAGRALIVQGIIAGAGKRSSLKIKPSDVRFGRARALGAGDESIEVPLTLRTPLGPLPIIIAFMRLDRVWGGLVLDGFPGGHPIATADISRLAKAVTDHMRAALTPANSVPPTITGTAQQGQALTVDAGSWTNEPTGFVYQWQRCDASGANCVAIAGATAQTYTLAPEDAGATIRASVTAANAVGSSAPVVSAPTPVVT